MIPRAAVISATATVCDMPACESAVSAIAGPRNATVCSLCRHLPREGSNMSLLCLCHVASQSSETGQLEMDMLSRCNHRLLYAKTHTNCRTYHMHYCYNTNNHP